MRTYEPVLLALLSFLFGLDELKWLEWRSSVNGFLSRYPGNFRELFSKTMQICSMNFKIFAMMTVTAGVGY